MSDQQTQRWATISLERIWPRVAAEFEAWAAAEPAAWADFEARLRREWGRLFALLLGLYGQHYDFFYQLEQLVLSAARSWQGRAGWLKERDRAREGDPQWFQSQQMVGAVLYVDRFAHTLAGLKERIPYLKGLGVTYLHLMPLFRAPAGNSDGGYAVSSYRALNPALGTIDELRVLTAMLHEEGISVVLDFVFNHTS
ncbi:MAG: amylosucrase, partial [Chloroflexales bacterium]|nr:amylosucrase [Chloroflexales bacterium]